MPASPTIERVAVADPSPPEGFPAGLVLPALFQKPASGNMCWFRVTKISLPFESAFFDHWRRAKLDYIRRGFGVRKDNDQWFLFQWLGGRVGAYCLTPTGADILAKALATARGSFAAPTVKFDPLPAGLEAKLWEYQRQPARQLLRSLKNGNAEWGYPGAVDLSDMGTGKTYMALAAALATGRKVVVICPPVGRPGWERAFAHFGAEPHFISTYEAVRGGWRPQVATVDGAGVFTWASPSEIILILDEGQALRHDDTLTVRAFSAAIRQGIPIVIASATIAISPLEFRFAGRIVGLHHGANDWHRFLVTHGCSRRTGSDAWKWGGGLHHLRKIHEQLFPLRGCRVRKESLGDACPETEINLLRIETPDGAEIEASWRDAMDTIARLRGRENPRRVQMLERQARMHIWQRCEHSLVPEVANLAKAAMDAGKSVAVLMNFNESRLAMSRLLNTNAGFYGGQQPSRRQYFEREFQANRIRSLVSNIGAGGASVSLHDLTGEFPREAFIFPTDNVVQMVQATGRVDRVGGKSRSLQWIPYVAGTMTERMVQRTRKKMSQINTLNDGDSGEL